MIITNSITKGTLHQVIILIVSQDLNKQAERPEAHKMETLLFLAVCIYLMNCK